VFIYLLRLVVQLQCGPSGEFDPSYPLRFFYGLILFCSTVVLWIHAVRGASEGRGLIIDFIGLCELLAHVPSVLHLNTAWPAYVPSRIQLLSLDLFIIVLQLLTATVGYETQLYFKSAGADTPDVLLPEDPTSSTSLSPLAASFQTLSTSDSDTPETNLRKVSRRNSALCIIDLRLSAVISRLRNPLPPIRQGNDTLLPLPNTTALRIPASLRMILRNSVRARRERVSVDADVTENTRREGSSDRRIPGGLG